MKNLILILCFGFLIIAGCDKHTEDPHPLPTSIRSFKDSVVMYDEFGKRLTDNSGVVVKFYLGSDTLVDTTDALGIFNFNNIDYTKNYSVIYQKPGFGIYKKLNNGSVYNIGNFNMQGISSTLAYGITVDSIVDPHDTGYTFNGLIAPAGTSSMPRSFRVFYGADTTVSSTNYSYSQYGYSYKTNAIFFNVTNGDLIHNGLIPGAKVYAVVYGEATYGAGVWSLSYKDQSGKDIYPSLHPIHSNVVVFRLRP